MEAAGVTADQIDTSQPEVLIDAISKMYQESGGNPSVLGLDPQANGQAELWVLGMGGQLNDADGVPTLDDPSNIAGIELLKQVVDAQGGYAKVRSFTDSFDTFGENNQFVADQVGAQVNAQWYRTCWATTWARSRSVPCRSATRTVSRSRWRAGRPSSSRPRPRTRTRPAPGC